MRQWGTYAELWKELRCPALISGAALVSAGTLIIGAPLAAAAFLGGCQDARRNAFSAVLAATLLLGDGIPQGDQCEEKNRGVVRAGESNASVHTLTDQQERSGGV